MELSHEFDYTNYLIGKYSVKKNFFGKLSNLKIGVEDFFIIIARNKKTKFIQISANIFSNINTRLVSIELQNISVQGDLINNTIEFFGKKKFRKIKFTSKDLLLEQHKDILKKNTKKTSVCTFKEAMEVNRIISEIKKK